MNLKYFYILFLVISITLLGCDLTNEDENTGTITIQIEKTGGVTGIEITGDITSMGTHHVTPPVSFNVHAEKYVSSGYYAQSDKDFNDINTNYKITIHDSGDCSPTITGTEL